VASARLVRNDLRHRCRGPERECISSPSIAIAKLTPDWRPLYAGSSQTSSAFRPRGDRLKVADFRFALENRLYHACQFRDLKSYARAGHILSRAELFALGNDHYTPFDSDSFDEVEDCDRDVFGNLSDGGNGYNGRRWLPNVYGPITMEFFPRALERSGTTVLQVRRGAIWSKDAKGRTPLNTVLEVLQLYLDPPGYGKGEFQLVQGTLHLADCCRVTVAPITIDGASLLENVRDVLGDVTTCEIVEREAAYASAHYNSLVEWASRALEHHGSPDSLPTGFLEWFNGLNGQDKQKRANLRRFATYLHHGTITALRETGGYFSDEFDIEGVKFGREYFYDLSDIGRLTEQDVRDRNALVDAIESRLRIYVSTAQRWDSLSRTSRDNMEFEEVRSWLERDYEDLEEVIASAND
jgi:hypothetical protein